ncbi:MAG: enoyl-CoA hydratase/isomerase family protein [Bacteroidetes bacterium]|nr:enoyl-CoA hydratase/isomerase family protein [Bacteroidota bacterium]
MDKSATYENIITEIREGILVITINRESRLNALNITMLAEIRMAMESAMATNGLKGIVITGSGQKAFAAGADISEFANFTVEEATRMSADGHEVLNIIENGPKPVIAAVNGFALGGGCELAMACHIRVAAENAKFGQPEVNLGVPPGYGGTQRLVQLIGKGRALEMLLTGEAIDANRALEIGLVNYVVPQEELWNKCKELIEKISVKSPVAVRKVINCVNDYFRPNVNGMQREIYEFGDAFGAEDFKEGTDAFLNKRKPNFTGK